MPAQCPVKSAQAATAWSQWLITSWPWSASWLFLIFSFINQAQMSIGLDKGWWLRLEQGSKVNRGIQLLLCRSKSSVNSPKSGMVPGVQGGENPKWKTKARTQWGKQLPNLVLKTNSRHYLEKCQCMLLYLWEFLSSKERRKWRTKNSSQNRHTSEIL